MIARDEGDVQQRFWAKVDKTSTCWNWTATITHNRGGYGQYGVNGKIVPAHRFAYELLVGPIPAGMQIDHICHNPRCVNPDHLRIASIKQNAENHQGTARSDNSSSGVRGVTWNKGCKKWQATVAHNRCHYYVGVFEDIEDAAAAVIAKRNELHTFNDMDRISI